MTLDDLIDKLSRIREECGGSISCFDSCGWNVYDAKVQTAGKAFPLEYEDFNFKENEAVLIIEIDNS